VSFAPAVSRDALRVMRLTIRGWHLQLMRDRNIDHLSRMFNPVLRGWMNYYGRFHGSAMDTIWKHLKAYLVRWSMRKYQTLDRHKRRAGRALGQLIAASPRGFVH